VAVLPARSHPSTSIDVAAAAASTAESVVARAAAWKKRRNSVSGADLRKQDPELDG